MLSDAQKSLLTHAAATADPTKRRQAAALARAGGANAEEAKHLLAEGFLEVIAPSFHLIPRGTAMASEVAFRASYRALDDATSHFTQIDQGTLEEALHATPGALAGLRMVISLTTNELAATTKLLDPGSKVSGNAIKAFERSDPVADPKPARRALVTTVVATVRAVMDGRLLTVPADAAHPMCCNARTSS